MKGGLLVEKYTEEGSRGAADTGAPGVYASMVRMRAGSATEPKSELKSISGHSRWHTAPNCHIGVYEEVPGGLWQIVTITHR